VITALLEAGVPMATARSAWLSTRTSGGWLTS